MNLRTRMALGLASVLSSVVLVHCSSDDASAPLGGAPDAAASPPDAATPIDAAGTPGSEDAAGGDAWAAIDAAGDGAGDAGDAAPPGCTYDEATDGGAAILGIYTLPSTSLAAVDPLLTPADLTSGLANGAGTVDDPGTGSGLDYLGGCPGAFAMVTDRGPNGDHGKTGKTFPIPAFTPTIARARLVGPAIALDAVLPILTADGAPVTGISNGPEDDVPYLSADASAPLSWNEDGLDTEDVRRLPNGDYAVCEEYSPSIAIVSGATGKVKVRYTPAGVTRPGAHYPVKPILPAVLTNRRANKGFEGLAVSPDGTRAYAVLQAPMGDEATYGASLVNRVVRIDHFDDPAAAVVSGHFVVLHHAASALGGTKQPKVYFNSATWLKDDTLLLLERGETKMKLVVADLTAATNLVGHPEKGEGTLAPEGDYAAAGVTPAAVTEALDSDEIPGLLVAPPGGAPVPDKLEGLAVVNRATVAITNDNDFGISNTQDHTRIWVIRLRAPLPLAAP